MNNVVQALREPVYMGWPPREVGEYLVGLELMADCLADARILHTAHFDETEVLYLDDIPIDPDYAKYIDLEQQGLFQYYTVRAKEDGRLVGNLMYLLHRSLHSKGMMHATEDAFFLLRDHRGGRLASELLAFAEQGLKHIGVTHVGMSDKSPLGAPDLGRFLDKRGYRKIAIYYLKSLQEDGSPHAE